MTDRRMTDFHALGAAARPLNDDEWGSERQIAAENAFTDAALTVLTQGQLDDIWHKATTEEGIAGTLAAITRRTVTLAQPTPPDASPLYLGARSAAEKAAEIVEGFNSGCSPSHFDSLLKEMGEIIAEARPKPAAAPPVQQPGAGETVKEPQQPYTVDGLIDHVRMLINQSRRVRAAWETGILAEEITTLQECVDFIAADVGYDYDPTQDPDTPFYDAPDEGDAPENAAYSEYRTAKLEIGEEPLSYDAWLDMERDLSALEAPAATVAREG